VWLVLVQIRTRCESRSTVHVSIERYVYAFFVDKLAEMNSIVVVVERVVTELHRFAQLLYFAWCTTHVNNPIGVLNQVEALVFACFEVDRVDFGFFKAFL
jgi:hypothetical protein